ncbi:peptide chain release factor 2 [Desulfovibrio sp. OttesenSCG-928-I05]|nr:peptide chain release factor 2 [Desulfovibrio sp. OttesenSCG-928-I05]
MYHLTELRSRATALFDQFETLWGRLDHTQQQRRLDEIEKQLAAPGAWDNPENLTPILQEKSLLENELGRSAKLKSLRDDVADWLALADEEEEETLPSLADALDALHKSLEQAELDMLLSGKEDHQSAILEIHPGAGGTEAQDWASMLLRMYLRWADQHGFATEYLDYLGGDEAGIKSVTLRIKGVNAFGFLRGESGIHRLIRISPFDSSGRRHTSFASVDVIPDVGQEIQIEINEADLRIDVFRASGAGGQHVNKTNSAVRITHNPTGIVVQCQNEKSQHHNRDTAMQILKARLYELELRKQEDERKNLYQDKDAINFGSQIRTYTLQPYRLVKDHRTGAEKGDVDAVLDGDIDLFVRDQLLYRHASKSAA